MADNAETVLRTAINAVSAAKVHEADLSVDANAKAAELEAEIARYEKLNGEQEVLKAKTKAKTQELNASFKLVKKGRADLARLVDAKLPADDPRRDLFRNDD